MIFAPLALALCLQEPAIDFAKAWSGIRSSIESRYYARKEMHDRMESLLNKYEPAAKNARDKSEFARDVNDMIADFGDSHFGFFTKSDQGFYVMEALMRRTGTEMPNIGAWFRPPKVVTGMAGYEIQMLLNGGAAEQAGLRKGDLLTQIDGQSFTPVDSLLPKVGTKVTVAFVRGGKPMSTQVDVTKTNGNDFFLEATKASVKIIESNGKKYGYIHLWTMSNEDQKNALANAVFGKLRNTDGFILDIRDGFGGRPEGFGDPFFRPEVNLTWGVGPNANQELFGYQRPLVVIINKGSRSAKEVFAFIIKQSKRATLVGEKTGGNVLGTFPSPVGDWAFLEIPMVDVKADGVRLEKVGVAPDVAVPQEFDESGKDLDVDEALRVLSKQAGRKR